MGWLLWIISYDDVIAHTLLQLHHSKNGPRSTPAVSQDFPLIEMLVSTDQTLLLKFLSRRVWSVETNILGCIVLYAIK